MLQCFNLDTSQPADAECYSHLSKMKFSCFKTYNFVLRPNCENKRKNLIKNILKNAIKLDFQQRFKVAGRMKLSKMSLFYIV